jgi:hypothetical protein
LLGVRVERLICQQNIQAPSDVGETVAPPTVAKRDGDRNDLRPAPQGQPIEVAHELRRNIVGMLLFDEQLQ